MSSSRVRSGRGAVAAGALICVVLAGCSGGQAGHTASRARPATVAADQNWRNASYRITCDGLVPRELQAKLVDGAARVPVDVSDSPSYDQLDVSLEATATGDVDGDGKPDTVVLLRCSPQPSNAFVEEVHVFRADGSQLGVLPSPQTLPETTILAPLYVPAGLSVQHEDVVAAMKEYGPNDSHASGPSVPFTARWHWNGTSFVRVPSS
jgi:hypothetical protein